ncbi:Protein of unknown function DUF3133 [Macleaya cordata]|uniref:Uncharacterized protein n=1 Tax=Macleaya cordata TaxID=56857 RepID=A0A200PRM9_MACCD|nr:Protein of unknown function DUF3133 [Macleaya cordata]
MAEGTKVRLVRCPKCDNLLPELPDFPVYQCGGCGTALQVKAKSTTTDGSSGKSDEERVRLGSEKSVSDREIDGVEIRQRREREENSSSSSCSRSENREIMTENMATGYGARYRRQSKAPMDSSIPGGDHDLNMKNDELMKVNIQKEVGEIKPQIGIASVSQQSAQIPNWPDPRRDGMMMNPRTERIQDEGARFSAPYPDEGPSNYQKSGSNYGYGEPMLNPGSNYHYTEQLSNQGSNYRYDEQISNINNPGVSERVEYLEQDRAELLRKLEELQIQLSRSGDVTGKPNERVPPLDGRMVPPDPYGVHDSRLPVDPSGTVIAPLHPYLPDKHVRRPLYFNQSHEEVQVMKRSDMELHNFYPPMHPPSEIPGYTDPFGPQIHGRIPNQPPHRYPNRPSHDYFYGGYMDFDPETVSSYQNNTFFHHPACSCMRCYNKHWQVPAQVPPAILRDRRFQNASSNPMLYQVENPGTFGSRGYHPRNANPPPLNSRERRTTVRMSTDLDSELGGFGHGRVERAAVAKRSVRRCYPVAGGAPFISCYNCFGLLKLPRKFLQMEKNERKLKCGACSTIITVLVESKKLVCTRKNPLEVNDGPVEVAQEVILRSQGHAKRDSTNSYSDDYDNSGYNFQSMDAEPILSAIDQRLNLSGSGKIHDIPSSSTATSEGEESPDSVIARRELSSSTELSPLKTMTPPLPGSPLQEHFEYSSYQRLVDQVGKGNKSKRMDQEELVPSLPTKSTTRQNSVKDASVATEMEMSFNDTVTSQDSSETTKEEDRRKIGKGGGSFFAGFMKKSLRDSSSSMSSHSEETEIPNVSINGHPVPDRLVRKAEKRAGRIHPGQYWYDFRAGFWGVIGLPCLGIIPPSIEEFNYPMPKNCSGGTTGVFVNGRELHQKDLDLLASRGLPTTRDRSYIIEISGSVLDEDSGEELDSLGKLAPTIEKLKHGFGMKVPRVAAA